MMLLFNNHHSLNKIVICDKNCIDFNNIVMKLLVVMVVIHIMMLYIYVKIEKW